MKRAKICEVSLAWLGIFLGIAGIQPGVHAAEIEQMITTAKTAANHQAIANYYDQQAAQARDQVTKHLTMAKAYETSLTLRSAGPSYWRVGAKDCDALQRSYQNIVAQDEALARMHRQLAAKVSGAQ